MNQGLNNLSDCPTIEQLRDVLLGVSSSPKWDAIEAHLESCTQCEATLDAITEQSDTFVRELCRRPCTADDEPGYQDLYRLLISSSDFALKPASSALELELPYQLGNYELQRPLGHGANGSVFAAHHVPLDRTVVVKLLHPDLDFDSGSVERFMQEVRAVGCLDHPNIVRATDAGETDGQHFLVMEHVPGIDVSSLLATCGPLSTADACEIVRQAAWGLAYLHDNGFVHRDVKPSNLLLTADAQIKLLDLGLVQSVRECIPGGNETGKLPHGTADYMSPEQWLTFDEVDGRSDLYSLGCSLCKLLTGSPPYRPIPAGFETKSEAHRDAPVPDLQSQRSDVGDQLQAIFAKLLSKDPALRFHSANELSDCLEPLVAGANLSRLAEQAGLEPQPAAVSTRATMTKPELRFTRRHAMVTASAALAGALLGWPTLRHKMALRAATTSLRTDVWRELSLANPSLLLPPTASTDGWEILGKNEYVITTPTRTLINLGRPVSAAYSLAVDLRLPFGHHNAGLFFQFVEDDSGRESVRFQTVELVRVDGDSDPEKSSTEYRMQWRAVRVNLQGQQSIVSGDVLAESALPLSVDPGTHSLEVRLRAHESPLVIWIGETIDWKLSFAGRSAVRIQKLGRVGLVAGVDEDDELRSEGSATTTKFLRPRLSYAGSTMTL